jgi:hypothetical protein
MPPNPDRFNHTPSLSLARLRGRVGWRLTALGWPRLVWYKILGIAIEHGPEKPPSGLLRERTRFGKDRAQWDGDELGMRRDFQPIKWGDRLPVAALLAIVLLAQGCTGSGSIGVPTSSVPAGTTATAAPPPSAPPPPASPSSPSFKDKVANFFSGASDKSPQPVANAQPDVDCPFIDVRQGASTLIIPPPPPDGGNEAMTLRYQGSFVRAARECAIVAGQMVMKVGVQGRIIVGPAGGPGHVDVPLRIAVVDAPSSGTKVVTTRFIQIPVDVTNADGASFTHIEEGLSFPLPTPQWELGNYVVYIGFDQLAATAKPAPAAKPRAKPKPNPNAPTG